MAKDKLSNTQKKGIAKLNPQGRAVDAVAEITGVCKATVYKAKREGKLLNHIDTVEQTNRELNVQNQILKTALQSQTIKKNSSRHS